MWFALLMPLLMLGACGSSDDTAVADPACASAPAVTWNNWGQGFFATRCGACHTATAQDRHGAPAGVDFTDAEAVALLRDDIARSVLVDGTMPLGGGLSEEDTALLTVFLVCSP